MKPVRRTASVFAVALVFAPAFALAATSQTKNPGGFDELPGGSPDELAALFYSALAIPDLAEWSARDRQELLDAVTVRYQRRLIDRAPSSSPQRTRRYVERLSRSPLAQEFPRVVRQTCAQYAFTTGACARHRGYVRRALVLEEMLAQRNLSLDQLETELAGKPRPKLSAWQTE